MTQSKQMPTKVYNLYIMINIWTYLLIYKVRLMMKTLYEPTGNGSARQPKLHSTICRCTLCMKSKIPDLIAQDHTQGLKATMVDRRDPDVEDSKPLMKATQAHAILKAGTTINMLEATGISEEQLPDRSGNIRITPPQELTIKAAWKNKSEETAKSGRNASVFGNLGVLLIPPSVKTIDIPKMNALAVPSSFLEKYGAELIPLGKPFTLDAVEDEELENLYLVQYDWDPDYIQNYVMKLQGGGGLFVETHPFPHVFTPLSPDCKGALILGVDRHDDTFDFASFEIPFGYTMKIGSNVIHGDSFFVGPYAIALTETELADSVILKQETPTRDVQHVIQTSTPLFSLPLLMEHRLSSEVNERMQKLNNELMVKKIRHEGATGKGLSFFQHLPGDVLSEVRDLSAEAQEAYDQRYGLVTYMPK